VKALVYFEVMTTAALVIGLLVANVWRPGAGMNIDVATLDASAVRQYATQAQSQGVLELIAHIVPTSAVGAFASGEIIQVLFFAVLFAFSLSLLGERGKPVLALVDVFTHVVFGVVAIIMKAAPVGAAGAMAFTVGRFGIATLLQLGQLMACVYLTCLLFVLGVLGAVMALCGISILRVIRYFKEELLIVLGTSSSEAALPRMIARLTNLGCHESVVGLVIPTGYSFNLDGTCIYLTLATLFLAQATNTAMGLASQLGVLALLLLTSKGAAGVTGSGFIVLAATLHGVGHIPVASIAIILGVDRFMSEARALTNLIGNGVATIVVAKWEGALDEARLHQMLNAAPALAVDEPERARPRPEALFPRA
jgi:aerobic C4-dicarboxylate transport protein